MSCVLTLTLDDAAQEHFEALRQQWFPPERNQIPAHLTLFHMLPDAEETAAALDKIARETRPFSMVVNELRSLGRGVAYFLDSHEAKSLHRNLSGVFAEHLSTQDRHGFRPHVVVQNKVDSRQARETLAILSADFAPWRCEAVGMDLWFYQGGPWLHLQRFAFTEEKA